MKCVIHVIIATVARGGSLSSITAKSLVEISCDVRASCSIYTVCVLSLVNWYMAQTLTIYWCVQ